MQRPPSAGQAQPTVSPALARLLKGSPPKHRPIWAYSVLLYSRFNSPPWPMKKHERTGLKVLYGERWSASSGGFFRYRVSPGRELARELGRDPVHIVAMLRGLTRKDPDVRRHMNPKGLRWWPQVGCELDRVNWTIAPNGLCSQCWDEGRRSPGRLMVFFDTKYPMVREYCDDHARPEWEIL